MCYEYIMAILQRIDSVSYLEKKPLSDRAAGLTQMFSPSGMALKPALFNITLKIVFHKHIY